MELAGRNMRKGSYVVSMVLVLVEAMIPLTEWAECASDHLFSYLHSLLENDSGVEFEVQSPQTFPDEALQNRFGWLLRL